MNANPWQKNASLQVNALEAAYDAYADMLYRLALSHLGSEHDAEDAVQDAFAKYITSAPEFTDDAHERAWLIRVTVNRCHDMARQRSVRTHEPLDEGLNVPDKPQTDSSGLLDALSRISEKYRTVIVLHHLEGFSVTEVASMLRITASSVKMRLSRGREQLALLLSKEEPDV